MQTLREVASTAPIGAADADQRAEGRRHVHQRQGQRQPGDRHRAHTVPDKDPVNDVVK